MGRKTWVVALGAVVAIAALGSTAQAAPQAKKLDKVTLQLKWVTQSQFAGYFAALTKNGIDPANKSDVTIFNQPFTMTDFLNKRIDAAAAMTYNELAQVLESKNPATGKLYTLRDLNVIPMQKQGTAMLEDNLFT